jgi:hypothetical protein
MLAYTIGNEEIIMSKEKRTFAWDTDLTVFINGDRTDGRGGKLFLLEEPEVEVVWDPNLKLFWEV